MEELKKISKMANINEENLFKIDFLKKEVELPISLFDDETDGAIDFIKNIVDKVKSEFDGLIENGDKKNLKHSN